MSGRSTEVAAPDPVDVLVVGAGVGGAALALALARAGLRVLVIERRGGPGNINRGDSLLPAVTRHLHRLGAMPALLAAGARPVAAMQVWHPRRGLLFEAPLATGSSSAPYLILPHPEIERALTTTACAAGPVALRYRCGLRRLLRRDRDGRVCGAVISEEGGAEQALHARLVVGADGASSVVREQLGLRLPLRPYAHSYFIVDALRPAAYEDRMRIDLHPRGGVLTVPQGRDRVGLGVLVHPEELTLFRAGRWEDKVAALRARSPLFAELTALPGGAHLYQLAQGHAARYTQAGAVLLGDAVHVTNPTAGQGMTMAIEDAVALARHVAPPLLGRAPDDALDDALDAYQRERRPRNRRQLLLSDWLSRAYAQPGVMAERARLGLFALGRTALGQRVQREVWARLALRGDA